MRIRLLMRHNSWRIFTVLFEKLLTSSRVIRRDLEIVEGVFAIRHRLSAISNNPTGPTIVSRKAKEHSRTYALSAELFTEVLIVPKHRPDGPARICASPPSDVNTVLLAYPRHCLRRELCQTTRILTSCFRVPSTLLVNLSGKKHNRRFWPPHNSSILLQILFVLISPLKRLCRR